jgi:hypothetical protein
MNSLALVSEHVTLPARYEAAKRALAECERIDECQDWANKAAALAEYGRQSKDDSLIIMAQRIQARAIRRSGELLREIPAGHPASDRITRTQVAQAAGLSRVQQRQAVQIARIPTKTFNRLVEASAPPRPYKLAQMGVQKRPDRLNEVVTERLRRQLEKAEKIARFRAEQLTTALNHVAEIRARLANYARAA